MKNENKEVDDAKNPYYCEICADDELMDPGGGDLVEKDGDGGADEGGEGRINDLAKKPRVESNTLSLSMVYFLLFAGLDNAPKTDACVCGEDELLAKSATASVMGTFGRGELTTEENMSQSSSITFLIIANLTKARREAESQIRASDVMTRMYTPSPLGSIS